eukprot:15450978-Alexandrium_andersonii.AAC.1
MGAKVNSRGGREAEFRRLRAQAVDSSSFSKTLASVIVSALRVLHWLCVTAPRRAPGYTIKECGARKWNEHKYARPWNDDDRTLYT